jgi:putative transposase
VRHKGKPAGKAIPFLIGRHRHAKTRADDGGQRTEPEPTGIDYLRILDAAHGAELQAQINYAALITPGQDEASPGPDSLSQDQDQEQGEQDSRG